MRNPCAEEYQNNTVSQISGKISRMRKRLKPGVLSSARERRVRGYHTHLQQRFPHSSTSSTPLINLHIKATTHFHYANEMGLIGHAIHAHNNKINLASFNGKLKLISTFTSGIQDVVKYVTSPLLIIATTTQC